MSIENWNYNYHICLHRLKTHSFKIENGKTYSFKIEKREKGEDGWGANIAQIIPGSLSGSDHSESLYCQYTCKVHLP